MVFYKNDPKVSWYEKKLVLVGSKLPWFEGIEPFQDRTPWMALKKPLICHTGLEKWPTGRDSMSKNVQKIWNFENFTFLTPLSKLAPRKAKKGPKSLLKAIFPLVILPLDDSDGFRPKIWGWPKKFYIWAGITHMKSLETFVI